MATTNRVKVTKKPTLKSQGAGYSTTNRQGVTTFYKSSKDAPGYSDSNSKGKAPISRFDSSGNIITSASIKPTPDLMSTLPKPQPVDGLFGVQDSNTAALAATTGATFDTKTKQIIPVVQNQAQDTFQQYLSYLDSAQSELPSSESMVKAQRKEIRPYEQNVQRYQNELNTITADRERAILSLEGQGRGQTEGFIGGEQARISREAAIRALPVQAQLAAAQQDLDSARSYTAQLFQARAQDAQARYNYKKEIGQTIFSYLNQQEQRAYAERQREDDRAFSVEQANRNNLKQLSLQAIEYGQGALAGEIMRLDPTSPTFDQDYGDVTSRLRKPVAAVSVPKRDTQVVDGKLIDMQTGEVIAEVGTPGANPMGTLNGKPQNTTQSQVQGYADRLSQADSIFDTVEEQFTSKVAYGDYLPNFLQSSERQQFEQSKRNFVNAVLRRESGAVISDKEFENAEKQYFAQPGDSKETLNQKRANRNLVINNFYREANVPRPVMAGDIITDESTGKNYRVADDGVTLEEV